MEGSLERKEEALRERFHKHAEKLNEYLRKLPDLVVGERCYIQNQAGNLPKRLDRSGKVIEFLQHDSYIIKVDCTGRLTRLNRRYLRRFTPASPVVKYEKLNVGIPIPMPAVTPIVPVGKSSPRSNDNFQPIVGSQDPALHAIDKPASKTSYHIHFRNLHHRIRHLHHKLRYLILC